MSTPFSMTAMLAALHSRAAVLKQVSVAGGALKNGVTPLTRRAAAAPQLGSGSVVLTPPPASWLAS